jgi:hypothetical protein
MRKAGRERPLSGSSSRQAIQAMSSSLPPSLPPSLPTFARHVDIVRAHLVLPRFLPIGVLAGAGPDVPVGEGGERQPSQIVALVGEIDHVGKCC